ncbi:JNK-interacting protein [Caenorhabditis elegans]|uniref:Isoform b of JNK-interacting protein n=1 Tax=Caenorhabditis elegans TaxID=6239 RepID=P34609-5|nr:JNK-interacting protein [Caenorhabditis elegans]AAL23934.1 UNC-16 [Caenorhabditis elegans]CAD45611.1 JNK-interacting protein [Caenorhabditis elegans]|eukprot:NP_001022981.1 JNK-interacting protein [Caenorhabditis elegans]
MACNLSPVNEMADSITSSTPSEIVYGGPGSPDEHRTMSDKVQTMASAIYRELETMIKVHGEDGVKTLMPLVVNVLEALDLAYLERDEQTAELEMLKEDNEQLQTQYEREKALRKQTEQKYIEIEDTLIGQNKELDKKIESLESIMRMLELKAKNATDHASRLEEREVEQKLEFDRLHERYNTLLRTHVDHMERTKYLMGSEKFELMQNMPLPNMQLRNKMGMAASVDASSIRGVSDLISAHMTQSTTMDVNLANHITNEDWQDEFSSDIEPSPRDIPQSSADALTSPITTKEPTPKREAASPKQSEEEEADETTSVDPKENNDLLGADLTGMGREVENLIKENSELLDMKNALNIVKNDLINQVDELNSENMILRDENLSRQMVSEKMQEQITKHEEEIKTLKQKLMEKENEQEEDDVPMAMRKRFTRSEMQRVLMDRNAYKEKLMELEESIKWTEMQRAKKMQQQQQNVNQKKSGGIWEFFSSLLGDSVTPPASSRGNRASSSRGKMTRSVEYIDPDMISERRAAERREQYKLVREHVKKEDGRIEAYGWSLPNVEAEVSSVPIPVCCRPLLDNEPSLKIWCATGVVLRGGRDERGQWIVGDPIYFAPASMKKTKTSNHRPELEDEIKRARNLDARESELDEWQSSSLVWVVSSNQGKSLIAVLDANNPNNIIETFPACDSHLLCIQAVSGVMEGEPEMNEEQSKKYLSGGGKIKDLPEGLDGTDLGACEWVELRKMEDSEDGVPTYCSNDMKPSPKRTRDFSISEVAPVDSSAPVKEDPLPPPANRPGGRAALPPHIRDAMSKYDGVSGQMSGALPTVWMGGQNQYIYIHSAVTAWKQCLRRIKMPDAVLSIVHYKSRIFAALANGTIAIFHRNKHGEWSDEGYHSLRVGSATSSVRSLCLVSTNIWATYKNCVVVLDAESLQIVKVFAAHPRKDSQVRNMQWVGAGVWLSIRLDSTLRLYHAHTYEHLQDVDIEPYVTKMLGTSKLDFSYMRTTALLVSNRRLWIGTGTGVIISVPFSGQLEKKIETKDSKRPAGPGGLVRVYGATSENATNDEKTNDDFIPYCNLAHAQLSFHGHKDSVKFFLGVPGASKNGEDESAEVTLRRMLIMSGGDGYIDFRIGEENEPELTGQSIRPRDMSHLIIWEVDAELPILSK